MPRDERLMVHLLILDYHLLNRVPYNMLDDSSPLEQAEAGPSNVTDMKKDGTASKMRSHAGNVPVLPKSKLCPHCTATFTRTTHLNRHLRTRELLKT